MSDVCKACGNNVYGNKVSCPVCGVSLSSNRVSSKPRTSSNASTSGYQPRSSYSQGSSRQPTTSTTSSSHEGSGFGYAILGFFIWPVGLILYFALRESKPKASSGSLIGAVIAIILAVMVSM